MKALVVVLVVIFLSACSLVQNKPEATQVSTTPTAELQSGISHEEAIRFFDLVPGESKLMAMYQALKASDIEFRGPSMWSRGEVFMFIPVSNDKEIYIECFPDDEIRGEGTVLIVAYQLKDTGGMHYGSPLSVDCEISQQRNTCVSLEQFDDIIPGESTLEDINSIAEEAGLQGRKPQKYHYGLQMDLPVDEKSAITVVFDEDYTVISYTYRLADIERWIEENVNSNTQ